MAIGDLERAAGTRLSARAGEVRAQAVEAMD